MVRVTRIEFNDMVRIDHFSLNPVAHYAAMKVSEKQALSVRCPTCGARPGEKCELSTGLPRTDPHRDRRMAASDGVNLSGYRENMPLQDRLKMNECPLE